MLQRLAVFSGDWSMAAAQSMAAGDRLDESDVFDLMEQLVAKSLVTVNYPAEGQVRYGMLESIRQYGRDRLFESGESETLRDRFTDYYVNFAEEAGPHLRQSDMLSWMARIIAELDNLRAVMVWTLEERPELALRIAGSLIHGEVQWLHPSEARSWLETAIQRARELLVDESPTVIMDDYIRALIGLGATYGWYGRSADALPLLEEGIELARLHGQDRHLVYAIGIKYGGTLQARSEEQLRELEEAIAIGRKNDFVVELIYALASYALAFMAEGQMEEASQYVEEALGLALQLDNPYMNAVVHSGHGFLARLRGDLTAAREHALTAVANYETLNMKRSSVAARSELAHVARQTGNLEEAEAYYQQTILGWEELGHMPAVAHQVECFAYIALERGQYERAARLLGAAGNARQQLNMKSTIPIEIAELNQAMERLAEAMGVEGREKALAAGGQMSLNDAVTFALDRKR